MDLYDTRLTTFKSSSEYHVGFSIKGDVEVGGEDGGENGDDNGGKDGTHTKPLCFDYQILFGNSIIPMIPTHTNPYQHIPICTNPYQPKPEV